MNFNEIIEKFKDVKKIYTSETEVQFELMNIIKEKYPTASVRCEFSPKYNSNVKLDIVVFLEGKVYPIEIKFRKTSLKNVNDSNELEKVEYKHQGAPDDASFQCISDIRRIEEFIEKYGEECTRGYTLFLTNDFKYKKGNFKTKVWTDINFWKEKEINVKNNYNLKINGKKKHIYLKGSYKFEWNEYNIFDNPFYYFTITVDNGN